jgi:hypothetical protein
LLGSLLSALAGRQANVADRLGPGTSDPAQMSHQDAARLLD